PNCSSRLTLTHRRIICHRQVREPRMLRFIFSVRRHEFALALLVVTVSLAVGGRSALSAEKQAADTQAAKQTWVPISAGVLAKVKPGYPGKTAGVTVDPAN